MYLKKSPEKNVRELIYYFENEKQVPDNLIKKLKKDIPYFLVQNKTARFSEIFPYTELRERFSGSDEEFNQQYDSLESRLELLTPLEKKAIENNFIGKSILSVNHFCEIPGTVDFLEPLTDYTSLSDEEVLDFYQDLLYRVTDKEELWNSIKLASEIQPDTKIVDSCGAGIEISDFRVETPKSIISIAEETYTHLINPLRKGVLKYIIPEKINLKKIFAISSAMAFPLGTIIGASISSRKADAMYYSLKPITAEDLKGTFLEEKLEKFERETGSSSIASFFDSISKTYGSNFTFMQGEKFFPCDLNADDDDNVYNNAEKWINGNFDKTPTIANVHILSSSENLLTAHLFLCYVRNEKAGFIDTHDPDIETVSKVFNLTTGKILYTILSYHGKHFIYNRNVEEILVEKGGHAMVPLDLKKNEQNALPLRLLLSGVPGKRITKDEFSYNDSRMRRYPIHLGPLDMRIKGGLIEKFSPETLGYAATKRNIYDWFPDSDSAIPFKNEENIIQVIKLKNCPELCLETEDDFSNETHWGVYSAEPIKLSNGKAMLILDSSLPGDLFINGKKSEDFKMEFQQINRTITGSKTKKVEDTLHINSGELISVIPSDSTLTLSTYRNVLEYNLGRPSSINEYKWGSNSPETYSKVSFNKAICLGGLLSATLIGTFSSAGIIFYIIRKHNSKEDEE